LNETRADITDGADDKQIDAIYVDDDNNSVFILQGKFIGQSSVDAEPLREVLSSWVQLKQIVHLQENCNSKLKQKLSELSLALEEDYDVVFELVTTGALTAAAKNDLLIFQTQLADSEDFPASINLIDAEELSNRYEIALNKENPLIHHSITLNTGKYIQMELGETNVVMAALPLKDCLKFPGINDGTLFKKNVRQSLGLSNRVNKGIKNTIYHKSKDFFYYHNGITALCRSMILSEEGELELKGLNVVNGCQSLSTILSCSEKVKQLDDTHIMFRFYEIPDMERADKISVSTNSQSAVKARDLRSNDKKVLSLKKQYEQRYPSGYLITKRGEQAPADRDSNFIIDLSELGKLLMSWHSQRPNIAYSETRIFDKYFDQLFKRDYKPERIQALSSWRKEIKKNWIKENPLALNESLLAMKAYAPNHHLYAISLCFCVANNIGSNLVPDPEITYAKALNANLVDQIVAMAGTCLNSALEAAANEPQVNNRVFSPQNWIKTKSCLSGIRAAIRQYFTMLPAMPNGLELKKNLQEPMQLENSDFSDRWTAD
ncbi:MAG: AIPR family protein, partial [SAR324 cluster bacterium]|nr:AIPR family protein [SAR324 cluster bacterium]